jgi:hypothetical protein
VEKLELSNTAVRNIKWYGHLETAWKIFIHNININSTLKYSVNNTAEELAEGKGNIQ